MIFFNNRVLWFCKELKKAEKLIYDVDFSEPCAIVMGNEETGISKEVLHHADEKIKLPITGKNAISERFYFVCGAILYEAVRQKLVGIVELESCRDKS